MVQGCCGATDTLGKYHYIAASCFSATRHVFTDGQLRNNTLLMVWLRME